MPSTDTGYINKNNQRNNGKTELPGTDNMQWFYQMECLKCGFVYLANAQIYGKESVRNVRAVDRRRR